MPSIPKRKAPGQGPIKKSLEYPIADSIGYLIAVTSRKLQASFESQLSDKNITYGTWFFIRALWEEDGLGLTELAKRVATSTPTAMSAVRKLAAAGLVTIKDDPTDGRRVIVRLTRKGAALEESLLTRMEKLNQVLLKGLDADTTSELNRLLRVLQANSTDIGDL